MKVRIFQPSRNAMQSGRAKTQNWLMEFDQRAPREIDPLMGWTSSADTTQQVTMVFASKDEAIAHAQREGYEFDLREKAPRVIRTRSYADNFRFDRR